ncbi:MAG: ECF transporter S component [Faecalibacterium sp.]
MKTRNHSMQTLVLAAICLALCLVLPFLTGQIPQIGSALCPMHIPVLLAGFVCGPAYAAAVGFVAPLLRFMLFGMPPIFPTGIAMCFELAAYGAVSGLLYARLPRKTSSIYASLLSAMLAGRAVWGVVRVLLSGVAGSPFTWQMFLAGGFLNAIPGILVQILFIPLIVLALQKASLMRSN